ncbi:MAG: PolC-type DNA polymerase III [Clostridiales bacterium]|nr:PolC-type DNA polymerase III [Clostridiales bacterium]
MNTKVPFREMFSCCNSEDGFFSILDKANVISVSVDRKTASMRLKIEFPETPAPVIIGLIEEGVARELEINKVTVEHFISADAAKKASPQTRLPRMLVGKKIIGHSIPISELTVETGRCVVTGEVFGTELREVRNGTAKILDFNITDYTGSLRVSKFLRGEEDAAYEAITDGMYITVQGMVSYNRWHGDISMEPAAVRQDEKPVRKDNYSGEKRVELHLHSRYSALDALTDIGDVVKTAAKWGHKAIALTDHGVAQGFPELCSAGKKNGIKVIYGVEGYYINDVDDRVVVHGDGDFPLEGEFVAFDLETTGLSPENDRITEIGAVIMKDGKETDRFQTFVDPGRSIPYEVTKLTGIRDSDVKGAPSEAEAVGEFMKFVGGRPVVAHNADFDTAFIANACGRMGIEYDLTSLDTLVLAQNLLPELKKFTLDSVANYLSLPDFNHHRASDDALTCGLLLPHFFKRLRELGVERVADINAAMIPLRNKGNSRRQPKHIIILVKEQKGIRNLYEIISRAHLEHFKKYPIIPKSLLMRLRDGLIIGSACEAGEIFKAVVSGKSMRELKRLGEFYDFLEIQPICNNAFMVRNGTARDDEQLRDFNRRVVELADELGKPVVATGDVHFLEPEHEIFRRILLSNKFSDSDYPLPLYLKTTEEMMEEFAYLGPQKCYDVVIGNSNLIADMCDEVAPLPTGLFAPKIENSAEELQSLVYGKVNALYGDNPPELITKRLETELGGIIGRGYDVIYMSAQKLVAKSLAAGYLVGSRGSVGSSLVAFMSGITEVNSLPAHYRCPNCKHSDFEAGKDYGCGVDMPDAYCPVCGTKYVKDGFDIPFETFLGFAGDKVPDIDLNFSGEYQARAHKDTIDLFGESHVFRAGTIGTIAEKTAYGYVKKYLEERGMRVSKVEEDRLARGFTGVKRTTGQHPGGLVVIPQDHEIYDFCPVQHPADDPDTDIITTHFEYHSMESNLLKLDMLGHDDPTMIKYLEEFTGVDAKSIPLDDPETMRLFITPEALGIPEGDPIIGKTGSIAVPEFGTKFTREMLADTQPKKFSTLVRLSGFSHGTDVWLGNAKDLITSGTASVDQAIGCRDDIMIYLISCGVPPKDSFSIMEKVRKGKGLSTEHEQEMRDYGVPDWYIDSCKKIKYLFPKAHAVAYVTMAVRIAWFKVHRPEAFYCAYFSVRAPAFDLEVMSGGADSIRRKINEIEAKQDAKQAEKDLLTALEVAYEMYLRGIEFAPVDLYRSEATKFKIDGHRLIPPFTAITGLGESAALDIVAHRDERFLSIEEFSAACPKVSKTHIEQLKEAGAFGDIPDTAQISLF